jgi:RNA polymerase sigma factor (sigma-70 family)
VISRPPLGHRSTSVTLPPFQPLLDAHRADLHRFCGALVGPDDADDCFQETLLAALRAYPRLGSSANLRGWLFTIAHRKAVDVHRGRRRRPLVVADLPEQAAPVTARDEDPSLWDAVDALPPKQRTAVRLRFESDLAYAEVGAAIGCSEEAARRNVFEGLKRLREVLES